MYGLFNIRMFHLMPKETIQFCYSPVFKYLRSKCFNFNNFENTNNVCLLLNMRPFSSLHVKNLRPSLYFPPLKYKLNFYYVQESLLRTGLNSKKYATSKITSKHNSRKNQRFRSFQSIEDLTNSHIQATAAFRDTKRKVAEKMEKLKENVITVPNALCVARIAATPFLGYFIIQEFYTLSLGIFVVAGITDVADGYIARTFPGQQSMLGSFLDPAADKILVATLFFCLTVNGLIPIPLTALIILRDVLLMSAGFYIRYVSLPPPKTLSRYFNVSFPTAKLSPTSISKANTLIQLSLAAFSLAAPVYGFVDHFLLETMWYVVGVTTVLSGASYIYYSKDTYKFLTQRKGKKGIT